MRLHSRLTVYPGGVEAGKTEIPWSELDATVKNGRLLVRRRERSGFKTIRRYSIHSVDNVGGFLEIVKSTQRQYESQKKVSGSSAVAQNRERRGAAPSGAIPV